MAWKQWLAVVALVGIDHACLADQIHKAKNEAIEESGDVDSTDLKELHRRIGYLEDEVKELQQRSGRRQ